MVRQQAMQMRARREEEAKAGGSEASFGSAGSARSWDARKPWGQDFTPSSSLASSINAIQSWSKALAILSILGIVNIFVSIPGLVTSYKFGNCNRLMPQSRNALLYGVREMKGSAGCTILMAVVIGAVVAIFGILFITSGADCDGFYLREGGGRYLCYAVVGYVCLAYAGLILLPVIVCAANIQAHCTRILA